MITTVRYYQYFIIIICLTHSIMNLQNYYFSCTNISQIGNTTTSIVITAMLNKEKQHKKLHNCNSSYKVRAVNDHCRTTEMYLPRNSADQVLQVEGSFFVLSHLVRLGHKNERVGLKIITPLTGTRCAALLMVWLDTNYLLMQSSRTTL